MVIKRTRQSNKNTLSKESKVIKKPKTKLKSTESKNLDESEDYGKHLVLSKVFEKLQFKDLLNTNLVCQEWNQLTNPYIYKSIKMLRYRYKQFGYHGSVKNQKSLKSLELKSCIERLSKHANLVHQVKVCISFDALLGKQFFDTFTHLTTVQFVDLPICESVITTCLEPLKSLKYLKIESCIVRAIQENQERFKAIELPSTLTKLEINKVIFGGMTNLIKQSLVSHTHLQEFIYLRCNELSLLTPFINGYPTLKKLTLTERTQESSNTKLLNIIESNSQLIRLDYSSRALDSHLINRINASLTNLLELKLQGSQETLPSFHLQAKFTQSAHLTSLTLHSNQLSTEAYISILDSIPNLKKLNISINPQYNRLTSLIRRKYTSLIDLTYHRQLSFLAFDQADPMAQFFEDEFQNNCYTSAKSLQSLNFGYFDLIHLKPQHLNQFPNLERVQFINNEPIQAFNNMIFLIQTHLTTFEGWKFKIATGLNESRGLLYKRKTKLPLDLLDKPFHCYSN